MASLAHLLTRADCDEVLDKNAIELAAYQHRNSNTDYADTVAGRTATSTATRLARATADVARYTADLARPGQTKAELLRIQGNLITATAQRDHLALDTTGQTGSTAYLTELKADQVDGQIAFLTASTAAVTAHRATLLV